MPDLALVTLKLDSGPIEAGVKKAESAIQRLQKLLDEVGGSGSGGSAPKVPDPFEKPKAGALSYAQALARLQRQQGDYAGAIKTLTDAQEKLSKESTAYLRVQSQIVQVQAQQKRAAAGAATPTTPNPFKESKTDALVYAQNLARLQRTQGDYTGAIRTLTAAQGNLNKDSLAYLRIQTQIQQIQNQQKNVASGRNVGGIADRLGAIGNLPGLGGVGRFANDAQSAATAVESLAGGTGRLGLVLGGVGAAVAGAGVGILALAKNTADYSVEVAKAARATGLTASAIQGLALEGRTVGADFNDIIDAVNQFSTQLGDARNGSKELQAIFKYIGIDAKTFGGDINQAVDIAIRALAQMPPGIQRTIVASRLFGEEGARQILSMKNLEGGLAGLTAKYDALGNVMSDKAIAEGEKFNRTLTETQIRLEGIGRSIGNTVLPALNELIDSYGKMFSSETKFNDRIREFLRSATPKKDIFGYEFRDAVFPPGPGRSVADGQLYGPPAPAKPLPITGSGGTKSTPFIEDLRRSLDVLPPTFKAIAAGADLAERNLSNIERALFSGESAAGAFARNSEQMGLAILEGDRKLNLLGTQIRALGPVVDSAVEAFEKRRAELQGKKLTGPEREELDNLRQAAEGARSAFQGIVKDLHEVTDSTNALREAMKPLPVGLTDGLRRNAGLIVTDRNGQTPIEFETQRRAENAERKIRSTLEHDTRPTLREEAFGAQYIDEAGIKRRTRGAADDIGEEFFAGLFRYPFRENAARLADNISGFFADYFARKMNDALRNVLDNTLGKLLDTIFEKRTKKNGEETDGLISEGINGLLGKIFNRKKLPAGVKLEDDLEIGGSSRNFFDKIQEGFGKVTSKAGDFFGKIGDGFGSVFSSLGGIISKVLGGAGGFFKGIFSKIIGAFGGAGFGGAFAGGGSVFPGTFNLVGERGPEFFVPRQAGFIVNQQQAAAALAGGGSSGGGHTYVTVNFNGIQNPQDFNRNRNEIERQIAASVERGQRMKGAR